MMKVFNTITPKFTKKSPYLYCISKSPASISSSYRFCTIIPDSTNSPIKSSQSKSSLKLILARLQQHVKRTRFLQQSLIKMSLPDQDENKKMPMINPQKARLQINKLAPTVALYEQMQSLLKYSDLIKQNENDLKEMLSEISENEKEERKFCQEQLDKIEEKKQELIEEGIRMLVPPDMYDDYDEVTLEFRAGAGGTESALFVEDASNMILSFCGSMGWRTQIISSLKDSNLNKGYRILNVKIQGPQVHKILKCESGVHKVIRVPETQNKGRLHSSTISLVVMPSVPFDFVVNEKDIRYQYMRSSGPGGQSVNKTESACRAIHIPTNMSVMIQQDRSQDKNRKRATELLKQRLFEIQYKKNIEEETRKRKSQIGTMDRSEKIRTYNYPQDRITDHRTGLTKFGIQAMMEGQFLQEFITTYQQKIYNEKLEKVLEELRNDQKML